MLKKIVLYLKCLGLTRKDLMGFIPKGRTKDEKSKRSF